MAAQFIGCTVSLEIGGGLGFYQGVVKCVNSTNQMITLEKVLHNGKLTNKDVSFNAADIIDLKILKHGNTIQQVESKKQVKSATTSSKTNSELCIPDHGGGTSMVKESKAEYSPLKNDFSSNSHHKNLHNIRDSPKKQAHSSQAFQPIDPQSSSDKIHADSNSPIKSYQPRRKSRTSVGEILAHGSFTDSTNKNPSTYYNHNSAGAYQRRPNESNLISGNKRQWNRQQKINMRDETTFGTPIDEDLMNTEFDFEKNLALFDKQAVIEEIENSRPDVVRQADPKVEAKYRCNENVLPIKTNSKRQIFVPAAEAGEVVYVTDNGLIVPSISTDLRVNLLSTANQSGHTMSRQLEMMGRSATEVIISIIGGTHRLEPSNSHQTPIVVIVCGVNTQGAAGMNCGRQLESQGVQTVVVAPALPSSVSPSHLFTQESHLYSLTSGRITNDPKTLPSTVDLILDARFDLSGSVGVIANSWNSDINAWVTTSRASLVALDPPCQLPFSIVPKIRLCPALPLAHPPDKGRVFLMNLSIPHQVFTSLGIKYTSPFGVKMAVPLHAFE